MTRSSHSLRLLPATSVTRTSPVDHPDWNYRRAVGAVQRLRFRIIVRLLAEQRFHRLLELGYGSGVFMPELAARCDDLHGIDPHPMTEQVRSSLAEHGVPATLHQAVAESLPYPDGHFDGVVAVSTLEYVPDIEAACHEIRRVLTERGTLVVVTPGTSWLWNLPLRLATSQGASQYGNRREQLQPALRRHFRVDGEVRVPVVGGSLLRLYTGLRLRPA